MYVIVLCSGKSLPHVPLEHVPVQQSTLALQLSPSSKQVSTDLGASSTIGTSTMSRPCVLCSSICGALLDGGPDGGRGPHLRLLNMHAYYDEN